MEVTLSGVATTSFRSAPVIASRASDKKKTKKREKGLENDKEKKSNCSYSTFASTVHAAVLVILISRDTAHVNYVTTLPFDHA
jgi:hypothetical protein